MTSSCRVIVMILEESNYKSRASDIKRAFRDEIFDIYTAKPKKSVGSKARKRLRIDALKWSKKIDKNAYTVLISDTMITMSSSKRIASLIKRSIVDKISDFVYLNRYNDRCELSREITTNDLISTVTTSRPKGEDAILVSPKGRDIITGDSEVDDCIGKMSFRGRSFGETLSWYVENEYIDAAAFTPNMFEFDLIYNLDSNGDYCRTCMCAPLQLLAEQVSDGQGSSNVIFLVIVLIIVLMIAWALISIGSSCSSESQKDGG